MCPPGRPETAIETRPIANPSQAAALNGHFRSKCVRADLAGAASGSDNIIAE
jgi:hypothetical protein